MVRLPLMQKSMRGEEPNTPAFQRDRRPSVGRRCGSMGEGKNKSPTVVLDPGGPKAPLQLMRKLPKADIAKSRVHTCNSQGKRLGRKNTFEFISNPGDRTPT